MLLTNTIGKVDTLLISEIKLDTSIPLNQFLLDDLSPPNIVCRPQNGQRFMLSKTHHLNSHWMFIQVLKLKIVDRKWFASKKIA